MLLIKIELTLFIFCTTAFLVSWAAAAGAEQEGDKRVKNFASNIAILAFAAGAIVLVTLLITTVWTFL